MINILPRVLEEYWFNQERNFKSGRYFQSRFVPIGAFFVRRKCTSIMTLDNWSLNMATKGYRYDIRKYQELYFSEPIVSKWYQISLEERRSILKSYDLFAIKKGITPSNVKRLNQMMDNIFVSVLQEGLIASYHIYLQRGKRIRLLYSWLDNSSRGALEKNQNNINKFHIYADITYFQKSDQIKTFDFGGIDTKRNNGIDRFKKSFGGSLEYSYNFFYLDIHIFNFTRRLYQNLQKDLKVGGLPLNGTVRPSTQRLWQNDIANTDYQILAELFTYFTGGKETKFVDVGCGKGRVLNFLLINYPFNKCVGVEIDEKWAKKTRVRLKKYDVDVLSDDILDLEIEIYGDDICFYMYNPFSREICKKFFDKLSEFSNASNSIQVIYLNPVYHDDVINFRKSVIKTSSGHEAYIYENNCL